MGAIEGKPTRAPHSEGEEKKMPSTLDGMLISARTKVSELETLLASTRSGLEGCGIEEAKNETLSEQSTLMGSAEALVCRLNTLVQQTRAINARLFE